MFLTALLCAALAAPVGWSCSPELDYPAEERRVFIEYTGDEAQPYVVTQDLTPDIEGALPSGTLQATILLDGQSSFWTTKLAIEVLDGGYPAWIRLGGITPSWFAISTAEIWLDGTVPTGRFEVIGAYPDEPPNLPDGMAWGVYWKDEAGCVLLDQSADLATCVLDPRYVGAWPLAMADTTFRELLTEVTTREGAEQAAAMLVGAQLLPDGVYELWE